MANRKQTLQAALLPLLNGLIIGIAFTFLVAPVDKKLWAIPIVLASVALYANGFFGGNRFFVANSRGGYVSLTGRLFLFFIAVFLIRQYLQDYKIFTAVGFGTLYALDYAIKDLCLCLILMSVFWGEKSLPQVAGFISIITGIGFWAVSNLIVDALGLHLFKVEQQAEFGESRLDFIGTRWFPPLVVSNWSCSAACSIILVATLFIWWRAWQIRPSAFKKIYLLPLLISLLAGAVLIVRCQFRTQVIVLPLLLFWVVLVNHRRLKKLLYVLVLVWFVTAPFLLAGNRSELILSSLRVDDLLKSVGTRVDSRVFKLSGRSDLYANGLEKLEDVSTVLWGEGPSLRDASITSRGTYNYDAIDKDTEASRGQLYHAGFFDLLFSCGGVMTLIFLGILGLCLNFLWRFAGRKGLPDQVGFDMDLTLFYFLAWMVLSCTDPGIFGYFEMLVLALIPLFGAMRYITLPQRAPVVRPRAAPAYSSERTEPATN